MNQSLQFFLELAKLYNIMSRRFDGRLNGLGLNEFLVLYELSQARDEKLRRVDLAERVGLTASGVTRLLLPMEKIGLVRKTVNKDDARSSYVSLASGGKKKLEDALERAEEFCATILPSETEELDAATRLMGRLHA